MYELREIERRDFPTINAWKGNPELIDCLGGTYRYISEETDILWCENYMDNCSNSVRCAIVSDASDEIIGLVSLVKIDRFNQLAEFHIMIGEEEARGKGAESFAMKEMLSHAFYNLNLNRIELYVLPDNTRARHLYEKIGFKQEGIRRNANYKRGRFVDLIQYGILRDEFLDSKRGINRIPNYYCSFINGITLMEEVVRQCDDAFTQKVSGMPGYKDLIYKWSVSGIMACAVSRDIAGYVVLYANDYQTRTAYIPMLGVRPQFQRVGCGKYLIGVCEGIGMERGMENLSLEVLKSNTNGMEFYIHMGFQIQLEKDNSYIMHKKLFK